MEETIAYEALSAEQGDAIGPGEWSYRDHDDLDLEPLDIDQLSSGVTAIGPGSAAQGQGVAPEDACPDWPAHEVRISEIDVTADEQPFQLSCSICEDIGGADTAEEAQAIARLHEAFVATLVEKWSVDR